ncbi:hypothetical protein C1646_762606 [Rhizophagus diaphanus]|nr:hypothetical protein C1646_762606 [Rhizophagus diaphanus] [Rhizophagus sp. MUCL 43196]
MLAIQESDKEKFIDDTNIDYSYLYTNDTSFIDTNEENVTTMEIRTPKHDKGTTFDIIRKLVNQQMLQLNRNIDKLVKDFKKNQYKVDWEGRLGWDTKPPSERLIMLITKDKDINVVGMLLSVLTEAILRAADQYVMNKFMNLCLEVRQLYDTNIITSLDAIHASGYTIIPSTTNFFQNS